MKATGADGAWYRTFHPSGTPVYNRQGPAFVQQRRERAAQAHKNCRARRRCDFQITIKLYSSETRKLCQPAPRAPETVASPPFS
jgi:hypothetical protein